MKAAFPWNAEIKKKKVINFHQKLEWIYNPGNQNILINMLEYKVLYYLTAYVKYHNLKKNFIKKELSNNSAIALVFETQKNRILLHHTERRYFLRVSDNKIKSDLSSNSILTIPKLLLQFFLFVLYIHFRFYFYITFFSHSLIHTIY